GGGRRPRGDRLGGAAEQAGAVRHRAGRAARRDGGRRAGGARRAGVDPSTAPAEGGVDEVIPGGGTDAVLCPGSRHAPLSVALHRAQRSGRIRLHVRIDERTAAFLALGLALRSGRAVPVTCTSGTAAANLHPAVLEACYAGVPLLALTADRPPELVGTGA